MSSACWFHLFTRTKFALHFLCSNSPGQVTSPYRSWIRIKGKQMPRWAVILIVWLITVVCYYKVADWGFYWQSRFQHNQVDLNIKHVSSKGSSNAHQRTYQDVYKTISFLMITISYSVLLFLIASPFPRHTHFQVKSKLGTQKELDGRSLARREGNIYVLNK